MNNFVRHNTHGDVYKVELKSIANDYTDARLIASKLMRIEDNTFILDVGCACGDFGIILKNLNCNNIFGIDYNLNSLAIANNTNSYNSLSQVDLNSINGNLHFFNEIRFDYITVLDVLEHINQPLLTLINLSLNLKDERSKIIISLPNIAHGSIKSQLLANKFTYTKTGILDETHVRFYDEEAILNLITNANLEIVNGAVKLNLFRNSSKINLLSFITILLDKKSYIYQYVVSTKKSELNSQELLSLNSSKLTGITTNIYKYILREYRHAFFREIAPPNSYIRKFINKLK